ncbi:MAG: nicotinate (nicotinamide) nucleotide adenylyltransferase [Waddliaceae bacterium]|nr:nicotinate (nicotinamide) nucleotide adenylyltransferase [Waddliaceae bacterium]
MISEGARRIGFFGGSFDPPHLGHLELARSLMDAHGLDEVLFSPAQISPFKTGYPPASAEHRLQMLRLATEDEPRFRVIDIELEDKGASYTVDTVKKIIGFLKDGQVLYLLLGEDSVQHFHRWKEAEKLAEMVPLLVGRRPGFVFISTGNFYLDEKIKEGLTETPLLEISSTELREKLAKEADCTQMLPSKVLDYITQNQLYSCTNE